MVEPCVLIVCLAIRLKTKQILHTVYCSIIHYLQRFMAISKQCSSTLTQLLCIVACMCVFVCGVYVCVCVWRVRVCL